MLLREIFSFELEVLVALLSNQILDVVGEVALLLTDFVVAILEVICSDLREECNDFVPRYKIFELLK